MSYTPRPLTLNAQQETAVTHSNGALLVIAGAGSGKTRVITSRIAHLITHHKVAPESIIALTFTNKAAREMKERVLHMIGFDQQVPTIGTFHAYCLQLLKTHRHLLPFPDFSILDSDDQQQILQKLIKRFNLEKRITAKNSAHYLSTYKNAHELGLLDHIVIDQALSQVWGAYEQEKAKSHVLDFDDLLLYTIRLFKKNLSFKQMFQERIRHILIDEYQDTNKIQHALLLQMSQTEPTTLAIDSICAVGDEDQSIYSWRGATVANILQFQNDFPNATLVTIDQNYRSVQPILDVANTLINNNTQRNHKTLWSARSGADRIRLISCFSGYQEGDAIAYCVQALQEKKGSLGSLAILYRAHHQSRILEEALLRRSIPYHIVGGIQFYERKEIKDLLAYVRLVINPFDRVAFFRVINSPQRGLGSAFEQEFQQTWDANPLLDVHGITTHVLKQGIITGKKAQALKEFVGVIHSINATTPPVAALQEIIEKTAYYSYLQTQYETQEAESRRENIKELLRAVAHFQEEGITSITGFLDEVALLQDLLTDTSQAHERVQLMTLHAAKGLEFDTVIITGIEEGVLPSMHSMHSPESIEEERRLLYVGITRARERLLLSHARYRTTFGTMNSQEASRFIHELPKATLKQVDIGSWEISEMRHYFSDWLLSPQERLEASQATEHFKAFIPAQVKTVSKIPTWEISQKVKHTKFGIGIIVKIEQRSAEETVITARFNGQLKKIRSDFLSNC